DVTLTRHPRMLNRLDYDFINQPDLAQTLITLCPILGIPFHFTGLASLKIKETDRIVAMKNEMAKLGYVLHDANNAELIWDGERCEPLAQPAIDTYEDHRMAMSFAPLAIKLGEIRINNPEVVSKSYPHYWDDLRKAGFNIQQAG
nr:3-phosphoshikimate 1-carboxyvinyltransferase [Prevotella sp.]